MDARLDPRKRIVDLPVDVRQGRLAGIQGVFGRAKMTTRKRPGLDRTALL